MASAPNVVLRAGRKVLDYVKNIANDYKTVAIETLSHAKEHKVKSAVYASLCGGLGYAIKTHPSETELYDRLCELRQKMSILPINIHSSTADSALRTYTDLINTERLDVFDAVFCTLVFRRDYDRRVFSPVSQDSNLKDYFWNRYYRNFVDVGAFGHFYNLERAFIDYDVRQEEFPQSETQ